MKVLFFSAARLATGCAEVELDVADGVGQPEVWQALVARFPALADLRGSARLSRNEVYAEAGERFFAGDVVAVIPPVSGG